MTSVKVLIRMSLLFSVAPSSLWRALAQDEVEQLKRIVAAQQAEIEMLKENFFLYVQPPTGTRTVDSTCQRAEDLWEWLECGFWNTFPADLDGFAVQNLRAASGMDGWRNMMRQSSTRKGAGYRLSSPGIRRISKQRTSRLAMHCQFCNSGELETGAEV